MPPSERLIDDLADAILDGSPIDWAAAESSSDGTAQSLVGQLRCWQAFSRVGRAPPSLKLADRRSRSSGALSDPASPEPAVRVERRAGHVVIFGSSSGSAGARSERSTGPGIRGSIARSR